MFLWVGHCFFKVACFIEVSSKFMQEKTALFMFLALIADQPYAFFTSIRVNYARVNFFCVKECTA